VNTSSRQPQFTLSIKEREIRSVGERGEFSLKSVFFATVYHNVLKQHKQPKQGKPIVTLLARADLVIF
jgi:hypothetical protein